MTLFAIAASARRNDLGVTLTELHFVDTSSSKIARAYVLLEMIESKPPSWDIREFQAQIIELENSEKIKRLGYRIVKINAVDTLDETAQFLPQFSD
jgi:tRNA (Thr-GGU) A37 N-methylase